MSKWKKVRLDKIADVRDGTHDTPKPVKSGKKLITSKHIKGGLLDKSSAYFISESEYEEVNKRSKVDQYDVLISMIGTIGEVYVEENTPNYAIKNLGLIKTGNRELSLWIKYLLNTWHGKNEIEKMKSGTTQQFISLSNLRKMKVLLPETKELINIVNVLSRYDELVKNNNRRIQILEQTAEELYKEWFVRMRFPGYENTKFDKGIPEGWEVQKLSGLIRVTDGTHDTPKEVTDGVPLVTGRNIINGQIDFNTTYNISKEDHKKINVRSSIEKYDVLYSNIGTIGQMAIVHNDNKYSVKNLIILKTSQYDCYEYIYLHFKNDACQRHFDSIASGASQKFISLSEMRNYKILIPKKETLEQFKIYVSNLFNQIVLLSDQNQNLIKQRDLLLPRLMNGTIIVK